MRVLYPVLRHIVSQYRRRQDEYTINIWLTPSGTPIYWGALPGTAIRWLLPFKGSPFWPGRRSGTRRKGHLSCAATTAQTRRPQASLASSTGPQALGVGWLKPPLQDPPARTATLSPHWPHMFLHVLVHKRAAVGARRGQMAHPGARLPLPRPRRRPAGRLVRSPHRPRPRRHPPRHRRPPKPVTAAPQTGYR